jgi:hypothetical protein
MGGRALALAVMVAMAVTAAAQPALAATPKVHISRVTLQAAGVTVHQLPRGVPVTFAVTYRVRHLSARARCRAAVTIELRRLTSRFDLATPRSSTYARTGTYVWPVGGGAVRIDARYPPGTYRLTIRVRVLKPSGRVVASDIYRGRVQVI